MFHKCNNINDIKKLYKRLAFRLHPDYGSDPDLMILLTESYEMALQFLNSVEKLEKETQKPYQNSLEDVLIGDERLKIIDEIIEYSKLHTRFKTDYVNSIREYLEENLHITSSQYNSLVKIYYAFRMDKK